MKKILILIVFSSFYFSSTAQVDGDFENFNKYWEYKYRFWDTFIRIDWDEAHNPNTENANIGTFNGTFEGDPATDVLTNPNRLLYSKAGYSIPFDTYYEYAGHWCLDGFGLDESCHFGNAAELIEWNTNEERYCGVLKVGDATIRLGRYFGVLATEFALLSANNQTIAMQKTLDELYLALQAYRRLDKTANQYVSRAYHLQCSDSEINTTGFSGFFLRDDIPATFHEEFEDDENVFCTGPFASSDPNSFHAIQSSFACGDRKSETFHQLELEGLHFTSQDQIVGLLLGLGLVAKYIPVNATASNGTPILGTARGIAAGLVSFIAGPNCWPDNCTHFPGTTRCIQIPCIDYCLLNEQGGNLATTYFALHRALEFIAPGVGNDISPNSNDEYLWGAFSNDLGQTTNDNENMWLSLACFFDTDGHRQKVSDVSYSEGKYIFPVIQHLLFDTPFTSTSQQHTLGVLKAALSTAPCGSGPCTPCKDLNPNNCPCTQTSYEPNVTMYPSDWCNASANSGWFATDRWVKPDQRYDVSGDHQRYGGRHNGLDYMLGYNLYHLASLGSTPYFDTNNPENGIEYNLVDNTFYPSAITDGGDFYHFGTSDTPLNIGVPIIESTAKVQAKVSFPEPFDNTIVDGGVLYKSDDITLLPGFEVENGALFCTANFEDIACVDGAYYRDSKEKSKTEEKQVNERTIVDESLQFREIVSEDLQQFKIYPNPTTGEINIDYGLPEDQKITISIINSSGIIQEILIKDEPQAKGNYNYTYNGSRLKNGIYYIKVKSESGVNIAKVVLLH